MRSILQSPRTALVVGLLACAAVLAIWLAGATVDRLGLASFLTRWLHVLGAAVWVGMIWFVNFVQLAAIDQADEKLKAELVASVATRVATAIRHASHLTVVTGLLMLVETGYAFDRYVFSSAVYVPPLKMALMAGGSLAALAMWIVVHAVIRPGMRVVLADPPAPEPERQRARRLIATYARLNLVLALPVTFVMVAAAHLY